jgi:hypothetical protein
MRKTLTIRLGEEQEAWISRLSKQTGRPRGESVRQQIDRAMAEPRAQRFMRLAGTVSGPPDLSRRKGFAPS